MGTKVNNNNFITVQGWMVNELGLKGNSLLIYAIIFGFSQDGEGAYSGSQQYLADWTNTTKRNVINILNKLVDDGFLLKEENEVNGVKFYKYKALSQISPGVKKFPEGVKNFHRGSEKISPNNIDNNIDKNIDIYNSANFDKNDAFERFWSLYPRKTNKKKAKDAFIRKCTDEIMFQKMLSALVDQKQTDQWQNPKFIPHASTWLNGERWNDVLNVQKNRNSNRDWSWFNE